MTCTHSTPSQPLIHVPCLLLYDIGMGQSHTAVYAALYRGISRVAVKRLRCDILTIDVIEQRLNEACILSQLIHPNIVQFIGTR